jgi:hypothetical protein
MNITITRSGWLVLCAALGVGCYGGEGDGLSQSVEEARVGDRFTRLVPGAWSGLTHFRCAAVANGLPRTMTVGNCTITYTDTMCRQQINEEGKWVCQCSSRVTGTSGDCGGVQL